MVFILWWEYIVLIFLLLFICNKLLIGIVSMFFLMLCFLVIKKRVKDYFRDLIIEYGVLELIEFFFNLYEIIFYSLKLFLVFIVIFRLKKKFWY